MSKPASWFELVAYQALAVIFTDGAFSVATNIFVGSAQDISLSL